MFRFFKRTKEQKEINKVIKCKSFAEMVESLKSNGWCDPWGEYKKASIVGICKSPAIAKASRKAKKVYYSIEQVRYSQTPCIEWLIIEADDKTSGTWHIDFKLYCRPMKAE